MLILNDSAYLGDKMLSPEEGVCKLREGNLKLAAEKKIPNQKLLEDQDMAVGEPMLPQELIRRIQKLNPLVIVEKGGIPNAVAVRIPSVDDEGKPCKRYLTGFYIDRALPEFSSVVTDKNGLPVREIRGWRTVLLALFNNKVATYEQLKAMFGEPNGQRNTLWMSQTREKR
jgi:hypothetical protein